MISQRYFIFLLLLIFSSFELAAAKEQSTNRIRYGITRKKKKKSNDDNEYGKSSPDDNSSSSSSSSSDNDNSSKDESILVEIIIDFFKILFSSDNSDNNKDAEYETDNGSTARIDGKENWAAEPIDRHRLMLYTEHSYSRTDVSDGYSGEIGVYGIIKIIDQLSVSPMIGTKVNFNKMQYDFERDAYITNTKIGVQTDEMTYFFTAGLPIKVYMMLFPSDNNQLLHFSIGGGIMIIAEHIRFTRSNSWESIQTAHEQTRYLFSPLVSLRFGSLFRNASDGYMSLYLFIDYIFSSPKYGSSYPFDNVNGMLNAGLSIGFSLF
jgi:hypothetical protein